MAKVLWPLNTFLINALLRNLNLKHYYITFIADRIKVQISVLFRFSTKRKEVNYFVLSTFFFLCWKIKNYTVIHMYTTWAVVKLKCFPRFPNSLPTTTRQRREMPWTRLQIATFGKTAQVVYNCDDQLSIYIFLRSSNIWSFIYSFTFFIFYDLQSRKSVVTLIDLWDGKKEPGYLNEEMLSSQILGKRFSEFPNGSRTHDLPEIPVGTLKPLRYRGLVVSEAIYWILMCDTCPATLQDWHTQNCSPVKAGHLCFRNTSEHMKDLKFEMQRMIWRYDWSSLLYIHLAVVKFFLGSNFTTA